ncbi:MAG: hypothetical protein IPP71_03765 [Bacteroidetes bacterium]|nr:hypothetical protein [Bacteroidota bacterium]
MAPAIKRKDRFYFSLVVLLLAGWYCYTQYFKNAIPIAEYPVQLYMVPLVLLAIVLFKIPGNFVLHLWLVTATIIGQIVFSVFLFIMYFLLLSPLFMLIGYFTKKQVNPDSNWSSTKYINNDYQNMG